LNGGPAHCKASTYTGQHNTGKRCHASMPRAGFNPDIPVSEWSKTVWAFPRSHCDKPKLNLITKHDQIKAFTHSQPNHGIWSSQCEKFLTCVLGQCI